MALAWGSIRIFMDRIDRHAPRHAQMSDPGSHQDQDLMNVISEDDFWGFGQVVAIALLLAPLFFFLESIYGKSIRFSNAAIVWTIGNHIKRFSPIESVIMEKKNSGRLPTSASTHLISTDPLSSSGCSSAEPLTNLYECACFRSLVWLIYLLSLVIASEVLLDFPLSDGSANLEERFCYVFQFYLQWFGADLAILLLFTILSLCSCYAHDNLEFRWTLSAKMLVNRHPSKRTKLIGRILLVASVLILTTLSATVGFIALPMSRYHPDLP